MTLTFLTSFPLPDFFVSLRFCFRLFHRTSRGPNVKLQDDYILDPMRAVVGNQHNTIC